MTKPRISIVTPVYNGERFVHDTLHSILDQNYPGLEYLVIDAQSKDGTVKIIKDHADRLAYWVSEPDEGHPYALNKGFARATGDILAWLNADDLLMPGALSVVGEIFEQFPEIDWITGMPGVWSVQNQLMCVSEKMPVYGQKYIQTGNHDAFLLAFIQQESCFWRRSLWEKIGGKIDTRWDLAWDYELWMRMALHAPLVTANTVLGGSRHHPGQKTARFCEKYFDEMRRIRAEKPTIAKCEFLRSIRNRPLKALFKKLLVREKGSVLIWESYGEYRWQLHQRLVN